MYDPVARRFSDAAQRYEQSAKVQKLAAAQFDEWLAGLGLAAPDAIAEIGCGTGFFSRLLRQRYSNARLCLSDLAPEMVAVCRAQFAPSNLLRFEVQDGRSARFDPPANWVLSTMCFQWFQPLRPVLEHHLAHSRVLAFSILLDGSFSAWEGAHQALGVRSGLQSMLSFDAVLEACQLSAVQRIHTQRISLDEKHPDGLSFASSLRAIGADQAKENHRPVNLRAVCRQLENGFSANYEIGFFCLER